MGRKMIGIIIGMLVVAMLLPSITATAPSETKKRVFTGCYIEASGPIDFTWQLNDIAIGFRYRYISFWPVVFNEPDSDVTIYSKKNGDILWGDTFESGQWVLYLVGFIGKYNNDGSTADTLIANLEGRACFILISPDSDNQQHTTNQDVEQTISSSVTMNDIQSLKIKERYLNCYLEISGYMHHDWPAIIKYPNMLQIVWIYGLNSAKVLFGLYSYILFEEDASIKIYDKKDGKLLWQHQEIIDPLVTLIGFSGDYVIDDTPYQLPHITLNGNVRFLGIRLNDGYTMIKKVVGIVIEGLLIATIVSVGISIAQPIDEKNINTLSSSQIEIKIKGVWGIHAVIKNIGNRPQ